jgi:hypothetical protein
MSSVKPRTATRMPKPKYVIPGCPPGLEYFATLEQIQIEQNVSLMEAFVGWDSINKYALRNQNVQQFMYAFEDTDSCMGFIYFLRSSYTHTIEITYFFKRMCCGAQRRFFIHIVDNQNKEVMEITREFKCCARCCWCAGACDCCTYEVRVEAPPGNLIGSIRQT